MMRQTLHPSLIASGSGRTILIAGGERGVIYDALMYGLKKAVKEKAQQYGVWKEVLQWAKEHPLAVPFVNQDTDMIHSIAETGWTRWIVGDGGSWFNLDYNPNLSTDIRLRFDMQNYPCMLYGTGRSASPTITLNRLSQSGSHQQRFGNTSTAMPSVAVYQGKHSLRHNKEGIWVDGVKQLSYAEQGYFVTANKLSIFRDVAETTNVMIGAIDGINIGDDTTPQMYVPYKDANGEVQLLDLLTGNLAEKHGSFTIDLAPNQ